MASHRTFGAILLGNVVRRILSCCPACRPQHCDWIVRGCLSPTNKTGNGVFCWQLSHRRVVGWNTDLPPENDRLTVAWVFHMAKGSRGCIPKGFYSEPGTAKLCRSFDEFSVNTLGTSIARPCHWSRCVSSSSQSLSPLLDLSFSVLMLAGFADELGSPCSTDPNKIYEPRFIQTYLVLCLKYESLNIKEG